jgi:SAM-dependent methyltransferase/uncharacterized protein YbaR (Trm112 family)
LVNHFVEELKCPVCRGNLSQSNKDFANAFLDCSKCRESYPIVNGIPRMLTSTMREAMKGKSKIARSETTTDEASKVATANSFGYEWSHFSQMYEEWESNFKEYMRPHDAEFFKSKRVLDAGCGSGRHTYYSSRYGAEVWAVDLGAAIEVAKRNNAENETANFVQADLYNLPFAFESFDFIYSIGVLHHLPDPEGAFRNLLRYLKPGGEIQIYLYWKPEGQPMKRALLAVVNALRKLTTRLPHNLLHALSYPAAMAAFLFFVWPYQIMKRLPGLKTIAERLPMKQYAHYPFRVCVNDQFDRFSAPIENRYAKAEVEAWLKKVDLENIAVRPSWGWIGSGRKPLESKAD